eukprot:snap_masked-scaffold_21-processed-gene-3.20-mRNA-1 protein AED:1.00 eAED:1.00 QI:0/0/0/0/1/1/2/0/83
MFTPVAIQLLWQNTVLLCRLNIRAHKTDSCLILNAHKSARQHSLRQKLAGDLYCLDEESCHSEHLQVTTVSVFSPGLRRGIFH